MVDAETARAVSAYLKLVDAQSKTEKAARGVGKAGQEQDKSMGALVGKLGMLAAGYMTVTKAISFASDMGRNFVGVVDRVGAANLGLERSLRGLFALNDNAMRTESIRTNILRQSAAFAQTPGAIADAVFLAESALGNMDKAVRDTMISQSLLLSQLGTDMPTAVSGAAGALLIYQEQLKATGDQAGQTSRMMDQMVLTADLAKATQTEFFQYVTEFLSSGPARGFSFEDMLSLFPAASAISPTSRIAATRLRNVTDRLSKGEDELGIKLVGGPLEQLRQIFDASGGDIKVFTKIFEQELAGFAYTLAKMGDDVAAARARIDAVEQGFSRRKLEQIRTDPRSAMADLLGSMQQAGANAPAVLAQEQWIAKAAVEQSAYRAAKGMASPELQAIMEAGDFDKYQAWLKGNMPFVQEGMTFMEQQLRGSGETRQADYLRLLYGEQFGLEASQGYKGRTTTWGYEKRGKPMYTGALEAEFYQTANVASDMGMDLGLFSQFQFGGSAGGAAVTTDEASSAQAMYGTDMLKQWMAEMKQMIAALKENTAAQQKVKNTGRMVPASVE